MSNKNKYSKLSNYASITALIFISACASNGSGKSGTIADKFAAKSKVTAPNVELDSFRDLVPAATDDSVAWWHEFADEKLEKLVADAKSENISLLIASSRLKEARAQGRATIAGYAPRVDISTNAQSSFAIGDTKLTNAKTGADENSQTLSTSVLATSWEVPLFGRLGNSITGAKANEENARLGIDAAKIALVADIAAAYIDLRNSQTRLQYLNEDLERAKLLNEVAKDRLRVGLISKVDASYAETAMAAIAAQIPDAKLLVRNGLNRIAILRGVAPGSLDEFLAPISNYSFNRNILSVTSVPADFVRRRIDVRQAEQTAILAGAAVGISKADFLPHVSIGGALSVLSALQGAPIAAVVQHLTTTPSISFNLFDFGQKRAALTQSQERFNQALLNYKAVTLGALAEGQMTLSSYDFASERLNAAKSAEESSLTRYEAAQKSLKVGLISMKERVEAERDYIAARNSRLAAQAEYSNAAIALYRAFAGSPQII